MQIEEKQGMEKEKNKTIEIGEAEPKKGTNSELRKPKKKRPQHGKANKSQLMLSDANLLRQPLALTLLNYSPSVIGNRVIITIVRKLQDTFDKMIDEHAKKKTDWRQLSIFDQVETIGDYIIGPDEMAFEIHMSELVSDSKRYQEAFNEVYNFSGIQVTYDMVEERDGVRRTLTVSEQLFKTITVQEENMERVTDRNGRSIVRYKNRRPQVALVFSKSMANRIFSFRDKYGDFLDVPAIESSNQYFPRIYIFLSAFKNLEPPVKVVEYDTFREMLGLYKLGHPKATYTVYKDFFRRVIEPTMNEMKRKAEDGSIDIWFDMEKGTNDGRRSATPDWLRFNIHLTDLGQSIKDGKAAKSAEARLSELLVQEFSQSRTQATAILRKAKGTNMDALEAKLNELLVMKRSGKIAIEKSACSYFNKTIHAFIDKAIIDEAGRVAQADAAPSPTPAPAEVVGETPTSILAEPTHTVLPPAEWWQMLSDCKAALGDKGLWTVLSQMEYVGHDDMLLKVAMPTKQHIDIMESDEHLDTFFAVMRKHFGENTDLEYHIL